MWMILMLLVILGVRSQSHYCWLEIKYRTIIWPIILQITHLCLGLTLDGVVQTFLFLQVVDLSLVSQHFSLPGQSASLSQLVRPHTPYWGQDPGFTIGVGGGATKHCDKLDLVANHSRVLQYDHYWEFSSDFIWLPSFFRWWVCTHQVFSTKIKKVYHQH